MSASQPLDLWENKLVAEAPEVCGTSLWQPYQPNTFPSPFPPPRDSWAGHFPHKHVFSLCSQPLLLYDFQSNCLALEKHKQELFCCFIKLSWEMSKKKRKCHQNTLLLPSALTVRTRLGSTRISVGVGRVPGEREKCTPSIPLPFTGVL